ncbi:YpiB family protein [Enterococcus timonensis]|uniref:YpiB family protein n=1 Tax=Enterococcus timonensis TaxID=1852364 RepID=UPI0008D8E11C|nr:YpiB family protein [Enterococcus timonensis]
MNTPLITEKQHFIRWCLKNLAFKRPEIAWLLHFLLKNPEILTSIHFVERADQTPRGLVIDENGDYFLQIDEQMIEDAEQIFHEIRFHAGSKLFMEIKFPNAWENHFYLGVLEDNPFFSWNEEIDSETQMAVEKTLTQISLAEEKARLLQAIDQALEEGNQTQFQLLAQQLKNLDRF